MKSKFFFVFTFNCFFTFPDAINKLFVCLNWLNCNGDDEDDVYLFTSSLILSLISIFFFFFVASLQKRWKSSFISLLLEDCWLLMSKRKEIKFHTLNIVNRFGTELKELDTNSNNINNCCWWFKTIIFSISHHHHPSQIRKKKKNKRNVYNHQRIENLILQLLLLLSINHVHWARWPNHSNNNCWTSSSSSPLSSWRVISQRLHLTDKKWRESICRHQKFSLPIELKKGKINSSSSWLLLNLIHDLTSFVTLSTNHPFDLINSLLMDTCIKNLSPLNWRITLNNVSKVSKMKMMTIITVHVHVHSSFLNSLSLYHPFDPFLWLIQSILPQIIGLVGSSLLKCNL